MPWFHKVARSWHLFGDLPEKWLSEKWPMLNNLWCCKTYLVLRLNRDSVAGVSVRKVVVLCIHLESADLH